MENFEKEKDKRNVDEENAADTGITAAAEADADGKAAEGSEPAAGGEKTGSDRSSDLNKPKVRYYRNGAFVESEEEPALAAESTAAARAEESTQADESPNAADKSQKREDSTKKPKTKGEKRYSWAKLPTWGKALIIIALVIICIALVAGGCNRMIDGVVDGFSESFIGYNDSSVVTDFGYDYIGAVYIEGTISEDADSTSTYDHEYILNSIDAMMEDADNKGIILYLDTPGGSVFASDELYFKIKEYRETTQRPVYASMQSMAASGGYYISAPCDKIIANRNCWTGSIGVTLGTMYDVSELLENLGIKTQTISSGENKGMGSSTQAMTNEQRQIYQSMVDEAYEQFVKIVAEGRDMSVSEVKKLADGRVYTAKQALQNGLIDEIGTFDDAVADMKKQYKLEDCEVEDFVSVYSNDWTSLFGQIASNEASGISHSPLNAENIEKLMAMDGKVEFSYLCQIDK